MSYLCHYHDMDGDLRGWQREEPDIGCQACRAESMRHIQAGGGFAKRADFSLKEIEEYEKDNPHLMQTHTMDWTKEDDDYS